MLGRRPVRVTYAHKRRRVQTSKKLLSSPLEVLPPEMDDLTRTQMARRMLKRSRRVALSEQLDDPNVEQIREHLAKRIKHTQECAPNVGPPPQDDITFQTPFSSSKPGKELAVAKQVDPEQFSPVPVAKRVVTRTSSRNLKENNTGASQTLASPFNSRPGSATSSPNRKGRGRSSRRVFHGIFHAKSRTLSRTFKENARRASRKNSVVSLKDAAKGPPARHIKHQRYPSSPSSSYMRSQFVQEDWMIPPKALSRILGTYDDIPSPGEFVHSSASFYIDRPQSCSTPAMSQRRPDLRGHQTRTNNFLTSFSPHKDSPEVNDLGIEMVDDTAPPRRQAIHLSENSIFSSSDEFAIRSLPATNNGGISVERNTGRDEVPAFVARRPLGGRTLAGSFVAEYDDPLPDLAYSPALSVGTKMLGQEGVHKVSFGQQMFGMPGTSPAYGEIIHPRRNPASLTPPASPTTTTISCPPSSPASDLALELRSMNIRAVSGAGDQGRYSDGETCHSGATIPLQRCSHPLQDAVTVAENATRKSIKRVPARNRAGTIRATDFAKPASSVVPGLSLSSLSNVRRTRSGTVVGPDSKLATKDAGVAIRSAKGTPATVHAPIRFSGSDDELLLRSAWVEDLEYLGLAVPQESKGAEVEADEMNLGGLWHGMDSGPPRRLGLRRR